MKKICYLLFIVAVLASCRRPAADFTFDKSEYAPGETVKLTNTSLHANSYIWTMPYGESITDINVNYILSDTMPGGTYTVTLEAISKNGHRTTSNTKTFTVKSVLGPTTIWTSHTELLPMSIQVDGVVTGSITQAYASQPGCGANGCLVVSLRPGQHIIAGQNGSTTISNSINITSTNCRTLGLN